MHIKRTRSQHKSLTTNVHLLHQSASASFAFKLSYNHNKSKDTYSIHNKEAVDQKL